MNAGSVIGPQGDQGLKVLEAKWGPAGLDGEDGSSVISAVLDGERLVFTLSNNESIRTAPVVGPKVRPVKERAGGRVTKVTKVRWVLAVCLWSMSTPTSWSYP